MAARNRLAELSSYLAQRGYAPLSEIVTHMGVSVSTARRDLEEMQRLGMVRRTHGGAIYIGSREPLVDYGVRETRNVIEKEHIGAAAAEFIRDGDAIILDGGTTTYQLARRLRGRPVQIVTNSLPIANLLRSSSETELILLGGSFLPQSEVLLGPYAEGMVRSLHVRLAIMGTAGIAEDGLYNAHLLVVELQRMMMHAAEEVMIVADRSKFGRKSLARLCALNEVHRVVTDADIDPTWIDQLESAGVRTHLAPPPTEHARQLPAVV